MQGLLARLTGGGCWAVEETLYPHVSSQKAGGEWAMTSTWPCSMFLFRSVLFWSGLVWCSPRIGCVPMVVAHSLIIKPRWKVENGGGPAHTASDGTTGATTTIHIMITMWVGQRNSSSSSKISRSSSPNSRISTLREISAWPRYVKLS